MFVPVVEATPFFKSYSVWKTRFLPALKDGVSTREDTVQK